MTKYKFLLNSPFGKKDDVIEYSPYSSRYFFDPKEYPDLFQLVQGCKHGVLNEISPVRAITVIPCEKCGEWKEIEAEPVEDKKPCAFCSTEILNGRPCPHHGPKECKHTDIDTRIFATGQIWKCKDCNKILVDTINKPQPLKRFYDWTRSVNNNDSSTTTEMYLEQDLDQIYSAINELRGIK